MNTSFEPFREDSDALKSGETLRERMSETGYLFFRGLVPVDAVTRLYRDVLGILKANGLLDTDACGDEGLYRGGEPAERAALERFHKDINRLEAFESLAWTPSLLYVADALTDGGGVLIHARKICRVKYPNDPYDIVLPHQDYWYIRGATETYSVWIPLMPMDEEIGGLAVAPGSHLAGLREHARPSHSRFSGISTEDTRLVWYRSDFAPGDALVFHSLALHQGLLNRSPKVRVSVDYRYQRVGTPLEPSHLRPHLT
jgi:hypothetical protein